MSNEDIETRERLSPDDEAQRTADMFLTGAMARQRVQAERAERGTPGTCTNCDEACLPTTVYCDAACRDDHEARVRAHARSRGS